MKLASTLSRYAVLYKSTGHADADANGWVWGYINADGTVAVSASEKRKPMHRLPFTGGQY